MTGPNQILEECFMHHRRVTVKTWKDIQKKFFLVVKNHKLETRENEEFEQMGGL